jgi:hypothetical protein
VLLLMAILIAMLTVLQLLARQAFFSFKLKNMNEKY